MNPLDNRYLNTLETINGAGGDEIHLVMATAEALHFENQSSDAYSVGITDLAFDFRNPVFVQVPMILTFAYLRLCEKLPSYLAEYDGDGLAFEFYTVGYRSSGGATHVHLYSDGRKSIDNGVEVSRPVGYVIATDLVLRNEPPLSGNRLRSQLRGSP